MKIGSMNRERHAAPMQDELDRMVGTIRRTWRGEHNDDGGHTVVTATSFTGPLTGTVTGNVTGTVTGAMTQSGPWVLGSAAIITPAALTAGAGADWNPSGLATAVLIRVSASGAPRNLSGIVAQPDGTLLYLLNVGGVNNVVLVHDLTSAAANRFYCPGAANYTLTPYMGAVIVYDGTLTRWLVIG